MKYKEYNWWQKLIFLMLSFNLFIYTVIIYALLQEKIKWLIWVILIVTIIGSIYFSRTSHFLKKKSTNLFIFGPKGYGKDIIMQKSIYLKYDTHTLFKFLLNRNRRKPLANDDYGYGTIYKEPKEVFNLYPNTYANLIENDIKLIAKNHNFEGRDYYLTDSAIYFPSQEDSKLNKAYPSFPLYYATSRHIYNMNIIVNTQVNGRLWKKLREQVQDGYIEALGTIGWSKIFCAIPFLRRLVFTKIRYYSKIESAEQGLLPFNKIAIINTISDKTVYMTTAGATEEQYKAEHGIIKEMTILSFKKHIKYDTRIFHFKFFGYPAKDMELWEFIEKEHEKALEEDKERSKEREAEDKEKSPVAMAEKSI